MWPPPAINAEDVKRLVLVAGGVGIKYEDTLIASTLSDLRQSSYFDLLPHLQSAYPQS